MRRYLFILLLIVSIGILAAAESAPSATVGYFKKSVASNSWQTLSLPFNYPSTVVNDVVGFQFGEGDVIQDVLTGTNTTYIDNEWGFFGDLSDLLPGSAYWVYRAPSNADMEYYIMGTVNPQPVTTHVAAPGWTSFSLNEAASVPIGNLDTPGLEVIGAVDGDVMQDVLTGTNTTYIDGYGWFGDLIQFDPTQAYWYYTASTVSFDWTYPAARGTAGNSISNSGNVKTHTPHFNTIKK